MGRDREGLRVAFLAYRGNPHSGGQGVYTRHLTRELTALGHRVTVFAGQPYPVDAIMCGDHVVWINRDMAQAQLSLVADTVRQMFAPVTR